MVCLSRIVTFFVSRCYLAGLLETVTPRLGVYNHDQRKPYTSHFRK